jgi:hypothetical protein
VERLVRYVTGPLPHMHRILKYSGRPFHPIEILEAVQDVLKARGPSSNGQTTVVGRSANNVAARSSHMPPENIVARSSSAPADDMLAAD